MLIVTFDVLAYPTTDKSMSIGARQPAHESRKLWHALYNQYHGNLIIMATGTTRTDLIEGWAKLEGYKYAHIDVIESTKPEDIRDRVRDFNAIYGKIHWFVDSNPRTVKLVMEDAIPSLLVGLPAFVRPEWRENKQREHQLWDDLVREIEVQTIYRAEKEQK